MAEARRKLAAILFAEVVGCGRLVRALETDDDEHSHVYFRLFNEIPVILLVIIVILAILKPF